MSTDNPTNRTVVPSVSITTARTGATGGPATETSDVRAAGHPIIKTIEAGPDWAWCYRDDTYLK